MSKLHVEYFNAEVAATLATLAPGPHREQTVEAIVAIEVIYDYLDGLTERPVDDPLVAGARAYEALTGALGHSSRPQPDYYEFQPHRDDGGYLQELSNSAATALDGLPSRGAVAKTASFSAARCAEGQVRVHSASQIGMGQLEAWAQSSSRGIGLGWREYVAGAVASVLAVHALIATMAERSVTADEAAATDRAYLSICALSTMLDSLIDYERDLAAGEVWFMHHYDDRALLADRLVGVARDAVSKILGLPHSAHHLMTLAGVVAYYTSAPEAQGNLARPLVDRLHRELRPIIIPTFAVMRGWRTAKRVRAAMQ